MMDYRNAGRNYPLIISIGFIGSIIYYSQFLFKNYFPLSLFLSVVFIIPAAYYLIFGIKKFLFKRLVKNPKLSINKIAISSYHKYNHKNKKAIRLGDGYIWDQKTRQNFYEIENGVLLVKKIESKNISNMDESGLTYLKNLKPNKPFYLPLSELEGHTLLIGSTRTGKSVGLEHILFQLIQKGEPVVFIDPKGRDSYDKVKKFMDKMGLSKKLHYFNPYAPSESCRINILSNYISTSELASRIAGLIDSSGNKSFADFCNAVLNTIIDSLIVRNKSPNLVEINHFVQNLNIQEFSSVIYSYLEAVYSKEVRGQAENYVLRNGKPPLNDKKISTLLSMFYKDVLLQQENIHNSSALNNLLSLKDHPSDHYQKMIVAIKPVLTNLTSGDMEELLSPRDKNDTRNIINIETAIKNNDVIYFSVPALSDKKLGGYIGHILSLSIANISGKIYNEKKSFDERTPINIFLEEISEILNEGLIQMLNKGGGSGLRIFMTAQTKADFEVPFGVSGKSYGEQSLSNINNIISFRIKGVDTPKYVESLGGSTSVNAVSHTHTTGNIGSIQGMSREDLKKEDVLLVPADLLIRLPRLTYVAIIKSDVILGNVPIIVDE